MANGNFKFGLVICKSPAAKKKKRNKRNLLYKLSANYDGPQSYREGLKLNLCGVGGLKTKFMWRGKCQTLESYNILWSCLVYGIDLKKNYFSFYFLRDEK